MGKKKRTMEATKCIFAGIIFMFAGILGIASGQRPDMDTMAVIVGIIIGIIASIPTSVVFALITRQLQARGARFRKKHNQSPAVVVEPRDIAHFPRGDSAGRFCYPNPRRNIKRGKNV